MSWKTSVPLGVGAALVVLAAGIIGAAMFVGEQSEEMLHFYKEYRRTQQGPGVAAATPKAPAPGMELQGKWRGMTLSALGSPAAAALNLREAESGVAVTDPGAAATGGLQRGDVIVGMDRQPVRDMSDLFQASRKVPPTTPVLLDVQRGEQKVSLVLPAANSALRQQPQGQPAVQTPAPGQANQQWGVPAAAQQTWPARSYYCPRDGINVPAAAASPPFLCPQCRSPLLSRP